MQHKQILPKKKESSSLQKKKRIDFLITTIMISLLALVGLFMSHYNSDRFISGIKDFNTEVVSKGAICKNVCEVSNIVITIKLNENIDPVSINRKKDNLNIYMLKK